MNADTPPTTSSTASSTNASTDTAGALAAFTPGTTSWIKASFSGNGGNCVETRRHDDGVEVRDTKDHGAGPVLRFTSSEWRAFLAAAKAGEFDHLA